MDIFVYAFISLFAIINPIGSSAIFISLTKHYPSKSHHQAAYLIAVYGTFLLLGTFFLGPYVLRFFGLSISSIQVAGGILVFYTAWGMLNTQSKPGTKAEKTGSTDLSEMIFFPLTMPLTAGAGSIAVTISLAAKMEKSHTTGIQTIAAIVAAIILVFVTVAICYRYADSIFKKLGTTGTSVVASLSAFILLAIGVSVIWEGILGFVMPIIAHSH